MSLSKRLRFEVFKRDKFTCQYCGAKAPDVVLHVDHIEPRSKGGSDDILNLVTACAGCNGGKSDRRLSDDSAVKKKRNQLEELQERQEQLQMMLDWQRSLVDLDGQAVEAIADLWAELIPSQHLTEHGKQGVRKLLRRFGFNEVATALRIAVGQYVRLGAEDEVIPESAVLAFRKMGGICSIRAKEAAKPWLRDAYYVRGILRNRHDKGDLSWLDERQAMEFIEAAFSWDADPDEVRRIAKHATTWNGWRGDMADLIDQLQREAGDA